MSNHVEEQDFADNFSTENADIQHHMHTLQLISGAVFLVNGLESTINERCVNNPAVFISPLYNISLAIH